MNKTIMHQAYFLHQCYFEDLYDDTNPLRRPENKFDKELARQLLADAGWQVNKNTGQLEREGPAIHHSIPDAKPVLG